MIRKQTVELTVPLPPPSSKLTVPLPPPSSKSLNLEAALHAIRDDVHGVIGIWGMGGVGKTRLLNQINNELYCDPAFQVVLFITCPNECTEEKVQNKIISKLHLNLSGTAEQKQRKSRDDWDPSPNNHNGFVQKKSYSNYKISRYLCSNESKQDNQSELAELGTMHGLHSRRMLLRKP